jgi:hypothetical protein
MFMLWAGAVGSEDARLAAERDSSRTLARAQQLEVRVTAFSDSEAFRVARNVLADTTCCCGGGGLVG